MDDGTIITYEKLYDTLRLEKYKKELQKLDSDFNKLVVNYLEEKEAILKNQENKESIFASQSIPKTKRQLENARAILRELYERREGKIVQIALFNSRAGQRLQEADSMLESEIVFYDNLFSLFTLSRNNVLNNILTGKMPETDNKNGSFVKEKNVKFLREVSSFLGEDLRAYGPFKIDDVAKLPLKVSEVLIKNKLAEEI